MQDEFLVHDREGQPCPRCGTEIRRIVLGGRSTYFCPGCQQRLRAGGVAGRGDARSRDRAAMSAPPPGARTGSRSATGPTRPARRAAPRCWRRRGARGRGRSRWWTRNAGDRRHRCARAEPARSRRSCSPAAARSASRPRTAPCGGSRSADAVTATAGGLVPIVPAAVIYDLVEGDPGARPGPDAGYAACEAAAGGVPERGRVGAGAGRGGGEDPGSRALDADRRRLRRRRAAAAARRSRRSRW